MSPASSESSFSRRRKNRTFKSRLKRIERKLLIWWIRFAQKHRHSNILPFALFGLLFLDGFTIVIPSMLCLVVATTISPQRWLSFAFIFPFAATANNALFYFIGRALSTGELYQFLDTVGLEHLWETAQAALYKHGPMATFIGGLIGLPTQIILAVIGVNDVKVMKENVDLLSSFGPAITYAFLAHSLKAFILGGLTRYGWVRLEKKYGPSVKE